MKNILEKAGASMLRRILPTETAAASCAANKYHNPAGTQHNFGNGIVSCYDGCNPRNYSCAFFQEGVYYPYGSWTTKSGITC